MGKRSHLLSVLLVILALAGSTIGQRNSSCDVRDSLTDNKKVDVHCDCMQRLTQMDLSIAQLTINQTNCSETGLKLSWPELEAKVAPEVLILAGAKVFFTPNTSGKTWTPSIKQLDFVDCDIKELPANVFEGMDLLEEVRLMDTDVEVIKSDAFSKLSQLKLVEIANSSIAQIEDHAFNQLPALEDLAIVYSSIGSIESGAVTLLSAQAAERTRCPGLGRSMAEPKEMIGEVMGRKLSSIGNLSLPEYGTRLLLFKNNIFTVSSRAINSQTLGFLILAGNHILTVEEEAFDMELYNECEISAALFIGNTFETLGNWAFRGLKGKDGASYQAFIAMANNTFLTTFDLTFQLSENLVVFAVEENHFDCQCDNFGWVLRNPNSQIQRELEREIVSKAVCLDGTHLIAFASSCTDHGKTTTVAPTESTTKDMPITSSLPSVVTTSKPANSASTLTYTASVLSLVVFSLLL